MKLSEHITMWNDTSIKVMDVRHRFLESGEELRNYCLPASAYLYIVRGQASVRLNDSEFQVSRFHVLHSGKGAHLDISADVLLEYYLILYKAVLALPPPRVSARSPEGYKPFYMQYEFMPLYPLALLDLVESMRQEWMKPGSLPKFHARTLFYQFVYELLSQMQRQGIEPVRPDWVAQSIYYMQEHYMDTITLDQLAEMFDCSTRHLTKLFKMRVNESPIRLLTQIRMDKASRLLVETDATLQEIAERVGYPDSHTLSRSFRKHFGISPALFRSRYRAEGAVPEMPLARSRSAIVPLHSRLYIDNDYHSGNRNSREGNLYMFKVSQSASIAAASLLLCVALLLSACSGASNGNTNTATGASPSPSNSQIAATADATEAATGMRSYTDSLGQTLNIPVHPQRIIDLTGSSTGNLLLLGIKPLGIVNESLRNPYFKGMLDGIDDLGDGASAEKILSLDPDLIITYNTDESVYAKLSKIAPVVRLEYGKKSYRELLLEYGKITGKEQAAQDWINEWDKKINKYKPQITALVGDRTVSILQPFAKGIYAFGDRIGRGGEILYGDMQLKAPPIIQKEMHNLSFATALSLEKLPEYAGDYIFTSNWGWDDGNQDVVYGSQLWKDLPAVKNNRVYYINAEGSYFNDPISLKSQLEFIIESFLGIKAEAQ